MRNRDAVKQFYNFLVVEGHVSRNEFAFFERIKTESNFPAFLTQTDAATLLNSIGPNPAFDGIQIQPLWLYRNHPQG